MKKLFYDLETTGLKEYKHSIHQIAGIVEIDGEVRETFDIKCRPYPGGLIEPEALSVCGVTEEEIMAYPPMEYAYKSFIGVINRYVDKYDKNDKMFLIGFNNRGFDDRFLHTFFDINKDSYLASLFYFGIDVQSLALQYLSDRRVSMPSFKQKRVALELGLEVEGDKLHNALYDVELTRSIYRIVTGLEVEL